MDSGRLWQRRCAFAVTRSRNIKYAEDVRATIIKLLDECSLPRDALPYSDEFARMKTRFEKRGGRQVTDSEFWRMLSSIGKGGGLAKKTGKKRAPGTPRLTEEQQLEILRLFPDGIGDRDHLPYTAQFDELHRRFGKLTGRRLTKHEFWRVVSRVAKLSRKPKPLFQTAPLGGLPAELVQFLERTNPWWKAQPTREVKRFKRWAFKEVLSRLKADIAPVVVIRGPRRVGKSTIQEQVIEHLLLIERVGPQRILRVQFDEVPGLGVLKNPVDAIVRWYEDNVLHETVNALARRGDVVYLLFDELQNLTSWSDQLKALVDHVSARTFVTGSSALRIARGRDSLAGRMTPIELGPLRLGEIAGIRGLRELPTFAPESSLEDWKNKEFWLDLVAFGRRHTRIRDKTFGYFSALGGYPICHTAAVSDINLIRQQIVGEVVTKTIEFDAAHRPHTPAIDPQFLRETFRRICRYAGQHVRPRALAQEIGAVLQTAVTDAKVNEAIQFLTDSMLVHAIPPLEMLQKRQKSSAKLCLCDHFVRNGVLQETIPLAPASLANASEAVCGAAGHLIESVLGYYLRGIPGLDIAWFPSREREPEIDFVLTIGTQRIPVEVKYRRGGPKGDDFAGINSFCGKEHYSAPFGLVITQQTEGSIGDHTIAVPAASFLLVR